MKKWIIASSTVLALALLATAGLWWWTHRNPFPSDIRKDAGIPLYYPTKLPPKFKIIPDSFSQKHGVVLYSFDTPEGNKLNFTIEKAPSNYNFDELYGTTMENTKTVATSFGTAHIGTLGENTMGSLVTGNTWILATYSQAGANDDVTAIIQSLKRY